MSCDVASGTSLVGSYTNERHTLRSSPKFRRYKAVFLKQKAQFGGEDEKIELEKKDGTSNQFENDLLEPYADEPLVGRRMAQKLQARAGGKQRTGES